MSELKDVELGKHEATSGSTSKTQSSPSPSSEEVDAKQSSDEDASPSLLSRIFWTPPWCRYDKASPPQFSIFQNILFAFAGAFTVANLYYNHPILNILARDFHVSDATVARIPTLMQSGYAVGLLLICPLGDLFPRRPYTLTLVFFTATMWIGLCVTKNFNSFLGISFITAITTVTPQIMLPLVGELAPPHKRALSLSIVVSGNLLGIVIARILSGVVTNYTNWRNIYWIALGLQYFIFIMLYLFMPAYPSTNPLPSHGRLKAFLKTYPRMLLSIIKLAYKYPVLVQAGLVSYCTSAAFTNYWTTLTFLLSSSPYNLSPTPIGLFGLIGVAGIGLGPLYAKYLIQPLGVPLYAVLVGASINLVGCIIGAYTGTITIVGPIIQAFGLDAGLQITQIANRTAIYAVEPTGRNRVNTVFMLCTFLGQITGTAAGNAIYDRHGGWRSSASLGVGLVAASFLVVGARGPHEKGWIGWSGGWGKKDSRVGRDDGAVEKETDGNGSEPEVLLEASAAEAGAGAVEVEAREDSEAASKARQGRPSERKDDTSVDQRTSLYRQLSHGSDSHAMYADKDANR